MTSGDLLGAILIVAVAVASVAGMLAYTAVEIWGCS